METKPTLTTRPANTYVSEGGTYYWIYASGVINTVSVKPTSTATTTITLPSMSAKYINSNRNTAFAEVHAYLYKDYGKIGPLDGITYTKNESTISSNSEFALSSSTPTVSVNASYFEDVFGRSNKTRRFAPTMLVADNIDFFSAKMSGGHPQGEDGILLTYVEYEIVWDPEGNPSAHGWYEYDPINEEYVPTQDTEVDDTKLYYEYVNEYVWHGLADEDPGSELRFFPWPDVIDDVPCGGFWLDVPPEVTIQPLSSDTGGVFYKDVTTVSVPITNATAFYGGDFVTTKEGDAGIKLEIGSQSVSLTDIAFLTEDTTVDQSKVYYTLYTYPDGRKTYDERRSSLIHNPHEEGLYEIIDNPSGTLSIKLDTAGTFTPKITAIDSRGQKFEQALDPITVVDYNVTTVIPSISRVNSVNEPHEDPMPGIASDEGTNAAISTTVTYIDTTQNYLLEPQVSINGEIYHPGTETPWDIDWYLDWSPDNGFTGDPIDFDKYDPTNYHDKLIYNNVLYAKSDDTSPVQGTVYYEVVDIPTTNSEYFEEIVTPNNVNIVRYFSDQYTFNDIIVPQPDEIAFDSDHPLSVELLGDSVKRISGVTLCIDGGNFEVLNQDGSSWSDHSGLFTDITLSVNEYGSSDTKEEQIDAYIADYDGLFYAGYISLRYTLTSPDSSSGGDFTISITIDMSHITVEDIPQYRTYMWADVVTGRVSCSCNSYIHFDGIAPVQGGVSGHNPREEGWYIKVPHFEPPVTLYGWIKEEFDTDTSYNIGITGRTHWKNSAEVTTVLSQAFYLLSAAAGGHGIGIGMKVPASAERTGMHVGMDAVFYENIVFKKMAGVIQMFAGSIPPAGWLICDGSPLSVSDYPDLFAAIGNAYGGEGSLTPTPTGNFNLPDLQGRFALGAGEPNNNNVHAWGDNLTYNGTNKYDERIGNMGGESRHGLSESELPSHVHKFQRQQWYSADSVSASSSGTIYSWKASTGGTTSAGYKGSDAMYGPTGGNATHNNMPPYTAINYIIATGKMYDDDIES